MGKLHTLKRAVEREPEKWFVLFRHVDMSKINGRDREYKWKYPTGATFRDGKWIPCPGHRKYKGFIKKVLEDIGYEDFVS